MLALLLTGKSAATVLALLGYVGIGAGIGTRLAKDGHGSATASSALAAWPLLLPLLGEQPAPRDPDAGPYRTRIAQALVRLQEALGDPAAGDLSWEGEIAALRDVLLRADTRLRLVDRLLADEDGDEEVAKSRATLREARSRAADEIEAVISGIAQLRLQVGLLALEGDDLPVKARLRELAGRAGALEEVTRIGSRAV
ncbi:MAG: hypothetical protein KC912_09000 [Proteobacteria bacterium]|nr:hypothetical protein [Pseudomonadota bacterium]